MLKADDESTANKSSEECDCHNFETTFEEVSSEIHFGGDLASLFQKSEARRDDSCLKYSARS